MSNLPNMASIMQMYQTLTQNPMHILGNMGVPQNIANNPQAIIQHLMNTGKISQDQLNQAMQMKDNPMFKGLLK